MWVTESDVVSLRVWATQRVAELLRIQDREWMTSGELMEIISEVDPTGATLLNRFNDGCRKWYEFHLAVERDGKAGRLNDAEKQMLIALIAERDEARVALRDYVSHPGQLA